AEPGAPRLRHAALLVAETAFLAGAFHYRCACSGHGVPSSNGGRPDRRPPPRSQRVDEVVHFLLGRVLLVPVALLEFAHELVLLAGDRRPVIVGELAPLGAELAGKLIPLTPELVPIHRDAPS